jgi:diguanylate cyclase (GGDEF)-like protein
MDLDNFKGVNHLYGHLTGDFVLAEVGGLLSRHSRSTDLLCRYEGQRFACMLPNSDDSTCFRVCDRLRELLADHCFDVDSKAVYITASFGLSSMADCEDKTGMDLLQEAMEALGTAKAKGRNRVTKFQGD